MPANLRALSAKNENCFPTALSLIQYPQARDTIRRKAFEALEIDPSEDRWRILLAWSCHLDDLHSLAVSELRKLDAERYGSTLEELLVQLGFSVGLGDGISINIE